MAGMAGAEGDRGWMGGEGRRRMAAGCIGLGWFGLMTGGGGVRGKRRRAGGLGRQRGTVDMSLSPGVHAVRYRSIESDM